jgi:hypothetical protein
MWAQLISVITGISFIIFPEVHSMNEFVANVYYVCGPFITGFSVVAAWQVTRIVRFANFPFALFFIFLPLSVPGDWIFIVHSIGSGLLLFILSFQKGKITKKTGGGWRELFQ